MMNAYSNDSVFIYRKLFCVYVFSLALNDSRLPVYLTSLTSIGHREISNRFRHLMKKTQICNNLNY